MIKRNFKIKKWSKFLNLPLEKPQGPGGFIGKFYQKYIEME